MLQNPPRAQMQSPAGGDAARWVAVGLLVVLALTAVLVTRKLVAPIDGLATRQVCEAHGAEIERETVGYERSNRLALVGRRDGSCTYAAAEGETGELVVPLAEANPGGTYGAVKVMTFILQLGAASFAVRVVADPLFDRFVRPREDPGRQA